MGALAARLSGHILGASAGVFAVDAVVSPRTNVSLELPLLMRGVAGGQARVTRAGTALAIIYLLNLRVWQKDRNRIKEMEDRQEARLKLVDSLGAFSEPRYTAPAPTEADRSQANDAKATDATSDTDANSPRSGD